MIKNSVNKKKYLFNASAVLVAVLIISGTFLRFNIKNEKATTVSAKPYTKECIIIDAGHGGFDGGAVAKDGTLEKELNLQISEKLADSLKLMGYSVIMTRDTDTGTDSTQSSKISLRKKSDMVNRLKIMEDNPNAIYIGIHLNKFTTSAANGAQVFYSPNNSNSKNLGESIQNSFKKLLQPENERVIKKGTKSTYLLYNAKIPAVIVECGFLSNSAELQKLKQEEYQVMTAHVISNGIASYFNN